MIIDSLADTGCVRSAIALVIFMRRTPLKVERDRQIFCIAKKSIGSYWLRIWEKWYSLILRSCLLTQDSGQKTAWLSNRLLCIGMNSILCEFSSKTTTKADLWCHYTWWGWPVSDLNSADWIDIKARCLKPLGWWWLWWLRRFGISEHQPLTAGQRARSPRAKIGQNWRKLTQIGPNWA